MASLLREQATKGETLPEDLFRAQLGEPHHHAYVVDDIEATVDRLVDQLGAGPFFLIEHVPLENVRSRGEPAEFVHNSAFGSCDGSAIELISKGRQPGQLPRRDVARDLGDRRGSDFRPRAPAGARRAGLLRAARPRIQHVGYVVPATEVADLRSSLDERGLTQYLSSELGEVETTLHDASATLGHDIEIHVDNQGLHGFFSMVSGAPAAEGWDGSEPLRPVAS